MEYKLNMVELFSAIRGEVSPTDNDAAIAAIFKRLVEENDLEPEALKAWIEMYAIDLKYEYGDDIDEILTRVRIWNLVAPEANRFFAHIYGDMLRMTPGGPVSIRWRWPAEPSPVDDHAHRPATDGIAAEQPRGPKNDR